ncbi:hypothetical protein [Flavobacterium sp. FlaQc-48]|uniref:hypothetical protein n=1 Tax=Flavobacterium sp. FlaQc-48 TaxID=3374181 RepID=UPI003756370E
MKKFLVQLIVFVSPIFIFLSVPTYILWQSKENFHNIDDVLISKDKYLIGYAYNENNYGFAKWTYLNKNENKNIWALGSSRVLQFRENMFETSFYNVGFTISSIKDFKPFIESIPSSKRAKYVIIALDQWMFNESYDDLNSVLPIEHWQNGFTYLPKLYPTYKIVYSNLLAGKYTFNSLNQDSNSYNKIGLNAQINNTGFRNDGSFFYGEQIVKLIAKDSTANDFNYSDTFDRIKHGDRRFQYCKFVNEKALVELNQLLKYCKEQKIFVVAFLPPFADKIYNKMNESGKYDYLKEIYNKVKPVFDNYNFEVYDFSKVSACNSNDSETIDGFHGGEITYQKLLISILESGSVLNRFSSVKRLKDDLLIKKNNYIIYNY